MSTDHPRHPVHDRPDFKDKDVHVFIAGSGPIGATFARLLVHAGFNVVMADIGDQATRVPASHKKNEIEYQKDMDRFVPIVQGALSPVSVPPSRTYINNLDPAAYQNPDHFIIKGRNPNQKDHKNLVAEPITRCVGGMATHWTCSTPRFTGEQLPCIFKDEALNQTEWDALYGVAEKLIGTSTHEFDQSIRHNLVLRTLQKAYPDRNVQPLPLACHRYSEGSPYVYWHSAAEIYGDIFTNPNNPDGSKRGAFALLPNTRCSELRKKDGTGPYEIKDIVVEDLLKDRSVNPVSGPRTPKSEIRRFYRIEAKIYVIAAGAVGTPQILAHSGFGGFEDESNPIIPNLGLRITEKPLAFCQIVLKKELIDSIPRVDDEFPIPLNDPEPQITIPFAPPQQLWHIQIHRDAFDYGEVGPKADPRVVVDLRWFGRQGPDVTNKLIFERKYKDAYDMPQPTFVYSPTEPYITQAHDMMRDMTEVAHKLGGYLPGSYPQFRPPGSAYHLGGSTRLGHSPDETVGDYNSQVWNFTNLYVGGNGNIPTPYATNPTLTSMCFALRAVLKIKKDLGPNHQVHAPAQGVEVDPVTEDDFKFVLDNLPDFKHYQMPPSADLTF